MRKTALLFAAVAILAAGACRRPVKPTTAPPPVAEAAPAPAPVPTTMVEPPTRDFTPPPPTPAEEQLTSDVAELNRLAREKGWIEDAFFNYDSFVLTPEAQSALSRAAGWLRDHPDYALNIEGHCDERGTEQYNLALGERRANTARTYILSLGIDGNRLTTVGYGEERPFEEGHDEAAWSQNRRAHLVLAPRSQRAPM